VRYLPLVFAAAFTLAVAACNETPVLTEPQADVATAPDGPVTPLLARSSWYLKVNGGGYLQSRQTDFYTQVSVTAFADGRVAGQLERETLWGENNSSGQPAGAMKYKVHGAVDALLVGTVDGHTIVNMCGEITTVQEVGTDDVHVGDPFGLAILDVDGGPDSIRYATLIDCQELFVPLVWRTTMVEGDFRVTHRITVPLDSD
jgi:hypothetical protein